MVEDEPEPHELGAPRARSDARLARARGGGVAVTESARAHSGRFKNEEKTVTIQVST